MADNSELDTKFLNGETPFAGAGEALHPSPADGAYSQPQIEPIHKPESGKRPPLKAITNKTARRIAIAHKHTPEAELLLPPFGTRQLNSRMLSQFDYQEWVNQELIAIEDLPDATAVLNTNRHAFLKYSASILIYLLGSLSVVLFLASLMFRPQGNEVIPWWVGVVLGAVTFVVVQVYRQLRPEASTSIDARLEQLWQTVSLVLVFLVGSVLPFFIIFVALSDSANVTKPELFDYNTSWNVRFLQFIFISLASVLPALFFFLFNRQHLQTMSENFFREVMILDPNVLTIDEAETKYTGAVREIYGSHKSGQLDLGKTVPIALASLLIMLGWLLALQPFGVVKELNLEKLLNPLSNTVNYGFLGSYFFAINMVFRRYLRSDLTTKAYSHITVRILVTTILVWVINVIPSESIKSVLLPFTFFIGVLPETGIAVVQQVLRKVIGGIIPSLKEQHPLSELDGMTLYDQARLLEEGIENVENLAHSNIIQLRLSTRFPMSRIVDLFDQAILYLHIINYETKADDDDQTNPNNAKNQYRDILRRFGIRTATDLEVALQNTALEQRTAFYSLLCDTPDAPIKRLKVTLDTLSDDEWMDMIRNWRKVSQTTETLHNPDAFYREAMVNCQSCSYPSLRDNKFCPNCGKSLTMPITLEPAKS